MHSFESKTTPASSHSATFSCHKHNIYCCSPNFQKVVTVQRTNLNRNKFFVTNSCLNSSSTCLLIPLGHWFLTLSTSSPHFFPLQNAQWLQYVPIPSRCFSLRATSSTPWPFHGPSRSSRACHALIYANPWTGWNQCRAWEEGLSLDRPMKLAFFTWQFSFLRCLHTATLLLNLHNLPSRLWTPIQDHSLKRVPRPVPKFKPFLMMLRFRLPSPPVSHVWKLKAWIYWQFTLLTLMNWTIFSLQLASFEPTMRRQVINL